MPKRAPIMEIEWTDTDPATGERRFVCARKFARAWQFKVRFKRRTNWQPVADVTREMWESLLDALERRYPRETASDADVATVRKILTNFRPPPQFDGPRAEFATEDTENTEKKPKEERKQ
jgi:hypothetical protein